MTATSSRNALPFRNALRVVNQNKKMTIVTCILQILGIPLATAAAMVELMVQSHYGDMNGIYHFLNRMNSEMYMIVGIILAGAAIFMGMFAAINSYMELHQKTKVDMLYALPLTGTQRFFSNYAGGCLMYIVPYLVSVILGWIVIFAMSPFVIWGSGDLSYTFPTFGDFIGQVGKYYGMGTFGLLLLMLLYFTLSVLVTVCCGTLFESIYTNILLNCLIPGTVALIIAIVTNEVDLEFEYSWYCIGFMSPIGGLTYLVMLITGEMDTTLVSSSYTFGATQTTSHEMLPSYLRWVFAILLLTAALCAGAWQLYKRRKAEDTGKPFVYIVAYYVMLTLGTMAILCMMEAELFGPALLFSAIVYFVMEVIRKRGFKKFWLSIVTYVATVAVSVGLFALIVGTECFGRKNYVPAAVGVSSMRIEYPENTNSGRNFEICLEYTDRDVINEVVQLHRDAVKDRSSNKGERTAHQTAWAKQLNAEMLEGRWAQIDYNLDTEYGTSIPTYSYNLPMTVTHTSDYGYEEIDDMLLNPKMPLPENAVGNYTNGQTVDITYYTLTGSTIHRSYTFTMDEMQRLYSIVRGTKLYAEANANGMYERMYSDYSEYNKNTRKSEIAENIRFIMANSANEGGLKYTEHMIYLNNAPERLAKIRDAYRADLEKMTEEDFRTAKIFGYLSQVPVYENCTETIALLKEYGMNGFTIPERYGFSDKENTNGSGFKVVGFRIYAPESSRAASTAYPHSSAAEVFFKDPVAYEDVLYATTNTSLKNYYPELYALLEAAQRNYVTTENCYVLYFGGDTYIIPESATNLAEAVIAKGNNYAAKMFSKTADEYGWTSSGGRDYFS